MTSIAEQKTDLHDSISIVESDFLNLSPDAMKAASVVLFKDLIERTKQGHFSEVRATIHALKIKIAQEKLLARTRRNNLSE